MRILIANTPLMYRESLALAVHRHNPDFEVMIADPASLDEEAERFGPHALVRDDGIEVGSPDDLHLHEDDAGSGPLDQGHGLLAVGCAAYHLHAPIGGQQASEPIPKQCVVVGK